MTRMRCAVLTGPGKVAIEERGVPAPAPGEVLVRLAVAGICGGDLNGFQRPAADALGLIIGHEGAGVIADPAGSPLAAGQRVVFDPQVHWCGHCEWCRRGWTEICGERRYLGRHVDGTFAPYVVVPADRILPIPETMSWDAAASVHGLAGAVFAAQRFHHEVGETALVLGPGAAGLLFVQLEKHGFGAGTVVLAGRSEARLRLGLALGADHAINTRAENLVARFMELSGGRGADVIIETTGSPMVRQHLAALAAPRGRVLSYALGPIAFDPMKEMSVHGSTGATGAMRPAIDLIASGRVRTAELISHRFDIEETQSALELAAGADKGAYVKGLIALY